jgi:uncharacterized protein YggE
MSISRGDESEAERPVISVRGEATLTVAPDEAELMILVVGQARLRSEAIELLATRNRHVLELLHARGPAVSEIASGEMSIAPIAPQQKGDKHRSHRGALRITASIRDLSAVGETVAEVADLEGVSIEGVRWRLRDPSAVQRDARRRAVDDAVARAHDYTAALGCEITDLVRLADTGMSGGAPVTMRYAMAPSDASANGGSAPEIDLEPEQQSIWAAVEAHFHSTHATVLARRPEEASVGS